MQTLLACKQNACFDHLTLWGGKLGSYQDSALPTVFDRFYGAALNPSEWVPALTGGAQALGVTGLSLMAAPGVRAPSISPPAFHELADEYIAKGWYQNNGRFLAYLDKARRGAGKGRYQILTNETVFPNDPMMKRLEIQQDFFRRYRIGAFAGAELCRGAGGRIYLSADRVDSESAFSLDELNTIDLVARHLERALQIVLALDAEAAASGLRSLEALGKPALALGRGMKVVTMNAKAEAHVGRGINVSGGSLSASDSRSNSALSHLVAMAASGASTQSLEVPGPVALRRDGARPLIAHAVPYRSEIADVFRSVQAIVLLTDPDVQPRSPSALALQTIFGLTPAEARLAAAVAAGVSIEDCAKTFGLTRSTLRNQLAAVFSKTGVRRQPELVAMIARLADF